MKSKKEKVLSLITCIFLLIICLLFLLIHMRAVNAKAFNRQIKNPERIFNGIFTDVRDWKNGLKLMKGDDICVSVNNQNKDYDEKNLIFTNTEKHIDENFNCYFIRRAEDTMYAEKTGNLETIWYLCKYDGVNSILLLNENNEEKGRITFIPGKESWLGKRELNYFLIIKGEKMQIYKRADAPYSAGTSYLKSKYYTGVYPSDVADSDSDGRPIDP